MKRSNSPFTAFKHVQPKVPTQRKPVARKRGEGEAPDPLRALWLKIDALDASQEKRWPTQGATAVGSVGLDDNSPGLSEQETAAVAAARKQRLRQIAADADKVVHRPVVSYACEYPAGVIPQPADWVEHRRNACQELSFNSFLYARYLFSLVDTAKEGYIRLHDLVNFRVHNPTKISLSAFEALRLRGDGKVYIDEFICMFFPNVPRQRITAAVAHFEESFNLPFSSLSIPQRHELKAMYEHLVHNESNDPRANPEPGKPFARISTRVLDRCHTTLDAIQSTAASLVNRLFEMRRRGASTLDDAVRAGSLLAVRALSLFTAGSTFKMANMPDIKLPLQQRLANSPQGEDGANVGDDDDADDPGDLSLSSTVKPSNNNEKSPPLRGFSLLRKAVEINRSSTPVPPAASSGAVNNHHSPPPHSAAVVTYAPHAHNTTMTTHSAAAPVVSGASTPPRQFLRRRGVSSAPRSSSPAHALEAAAVAGSSTANAAGSASFLARGRRGSLVAAYVPPKPSEPPPGFTDRHLSLLDLFELLTAHEVVFSPCEIVHMLRWRGGAASLHLEDVVRWIARAAVASGRLAAGLRYEEVIELVHRHMTTNPLASDDSVTTPLTKLVGEPLLQQLSRWVGKLQVAGAKGKMFEERIRTGLATGASFDAVVASAVDAPSHNEYGSGSGSGMGFARAAHGASSATTVAPSVSFTPPPPGRSGTTGSVLDTAVLELDPTEIVSECVARCPQCHDRTTAMCVSVAAAAKTVQDRKAAQNEAALKALLTCKCIMMDHPLFLLSVVVPFHAFQLLNQQIVAAPDRALHRIPTVLSPAAALQLDSLELYRDSHVAGGKPFDLPNKELVMKPTFIEELLADTRELVAQRVRNARLKQQEMAAKEARMDPEELRKKREKDEAERPTGAVENNAALAKLFLPAWKERVARYKK